MYYTCVTQLFDCPHACARNETSQGNMDEATAQELSKPFSENLNCDLILQLLQHICRQPPGAVLVFVPGWGDINTLNKLIEEDPCMGSCE